MDPLDPLVVAVDHFDWSCAVERLTHQSSWYSYSYSYCWYSWYSYSYFEQQDHQDDDADDDDDYDDIVSASTGGEDQQRASYVSFVFVFEKRLRERLAATVSWPLSAPSSSSSCCMYMYVYMYM